MNGFNHQDAPFEFDISRKPLFEDNKCRTPKINEAVRLLLATDKGFNEKGTTQIFKNSALSRQVELRGELSNLFLADLELLVQE